MTTIASARPMRQAAKDLLHAARIWPRTSTIAPLGGSPARSDRLLDPAGDPAQVLAVDVGRHAHHAPHVVAVVFAGHGARPDLGHVAEQQLAVRPAFWIGTVSICSSESITW